MAYTREKIERYNTDHVVHRQDAIDLDKPDKKIKGRGAIGVMGLETMLVWFI
jgi:hypothetical protein